MNIRATTSDSHSCTALKSNPSTADRLIQKHLLTHSKPILSTTPSIPCLCYTLHTRSISGAKIEVMADQSKKVWVMVNGEPAHFDGIPKRMHTTSEVLARAQKMLHTSKIEVKKDLGNTFVRFKVRASGLKGGSVDALCAAAVLAECTGKPLSDYPKYESVAKAFLKPANQESYDDVYEFPSRIDTVKDALAWAVDRMGLQKSLDGVKAEVTTSVGASVGTVLGLEGAVTFTWTAVENLGEWVNLKTIKAEFDAVAQDIKNAANAAKAAGQNTIPTATLRPIIAKAEKLKTHGANLKLDSLKTGNVAKVKKALQNLSKERNKALKEATKSDAQKNQEHFESVNHQLDAAAAGIDFFTSIYAHFHPKHASQVRAVGRQSIEIGKHVNTLCHFKNQLSLSQILKSGFAIGSAALAIGEALSLFGKTADSQYNAMIEKTLETLGILYEEMHQRFDRLESLMKEQHAIVMEEFRTLNQKVDNLRHVLIFESQKGNAQLQQLKLTIDSKFAASVNRVLAAYVKHAQGVATGNAIPQSNYSDLVHNLAVCGSGTSGVTCTLITGAQSGVVTGTPQEVTAMLPLNADTRMHMGYLYQYAVKKALLWPVVEVMNPVAWLEVADAYIELRIARKRDFEVSTNALLQPTLQPMVTLANHDKGIVKVGDDFEKIVQDIQLSGIFFDLLDEYLDGVQQLETIAMEDFDKHFRGTHVLGSVERALEKIDATTRLWHHFMRFAFPYSVQNDPQFPAFTLIDGKAPYALKSKRSLILAIRALCEKKERYAWKAFWLNVTETIPVLKGIIAQKQERIQTHREEECHLDVRFMRLKLQQFRHEMYEVPLQDGVKVPNPVSNLDTTTLCPDALFFHVRIGNEDAVREWVGQAGHDLNLRDAVGRTPTHVALESKESGVAHFLLDQPGIDLSAVDQRGNTLLHSAALSQDKERIQKVMALGVNSYQRNHLGQRAADCIPEDREDLHSLFPSYAPTIRALFRNPNGTVALVKKIEGANVTNIAQHNPRQALVDGNLIIPKNISPSQFAIQVVNIDTLNTYPGFPDDGVEITRPTPLSGHDFSDQGLVVHAQSIVGNELLFVEKSRNQQWVCFYCLDLRTHAVKTHKLAEPNPSCFDEIFFLGEGKVIISGQRVPPHNRGALRILDLNTKVETTLLETPKESWFIGAHKMYAVGDTLYVKSIGGGGPGPGGWTNVPSFVAIDLTTQKRTPLHIRMDGRGGRSHQDHYLDQKRGVIWGRSSKGITAWNLKDGEVKWLFPASGTAITSRFPPIYHVDIAHDRLYLLEDGGKLQVWDLNREDPTQNKIQEAQIPKGSYPSFSENGHFIINAQWGGSQTNFQQLFYDPDTGSALPVDFSPMQSHKRFHYIASEGDKIITARALGTTGSCTWSYDIWKVS